MKDNKEIIEKLKPYIVQYLEEKGININKPFKCLNPSHQDNKPSMSYNKNAYNVKCFSCGESYDLLDLIGIDYNTDDFIERVNIACNLFNVKSSYNNNNNNNNNNIAGKPVKPLPVRKIEEPKTKNLKELSSEILKYSKALQEKKIDYFTSRGISEEVIKEYRLGYCENFTIGTGGKSWKTVIIPLSKYMYNARNIDKNASKQERYRKKGTGYFFGHRKIKESGQKIFITEGEIDALSLISLGFETIATGGASGVNLLIQKIKENKTSNTFIILYDNDEAGQTGAKKLEEELKKIEQETYNINICKDTDYKDVNEFLTGNKPKLWEKVLEIYEDPQAVIKQEELKEYEKNNASNYIDNFINGIGESINTPSIPTGFRGLDKLLDGGFYEGLYFIGAISSLGKTTLTLQMADNIAATGKDVLVISLEMARNELIAKSISRLTFINSHNNDLEINKYAKDLRGITDGVRYQYYNKKEIEIIKKSTEDYREIAKHLYIYEGIGNIGVEEIKEIVKKHKELKGQAPVVIIDYVQILAPYDLRATDKQNTDKAVLELKRIARDFKTTILGISSFNRDSYSKGVNMGSFKESGAIEYGSDVLIGLQYKGVEEKEFNLEEAVKKFPREIELKILKNRNGRSHVKTDLEFYSHYNYFREK